VMCMLLVGVIRYCFKDWFVVIDVHAIHVESMFEYSIYDAFLNY
jgi:hypothetical protein